MSRVFITRISFLKKHKGFCRKLHFLNKTNIQCLMSDISQHADKCTFQLIHFVFSLLLKIKPGKSISKFSMIHLSLLPLQLLKGINIFHAVQ